MYKKKSYKGGDFDGSWMTKRWSPEFEAEETNRIAKERERQSQLSATKDSAGYKSATQTEKEEILKFFKKNNYRQLFPGKDKFKEGSFYYTIEETGPDDDSYLAPIKKKCIIVKNGGLECLLRNAKGGYSDVTKNLTRDEIYEKKGFFGKSATNDWKRPENYKDKFANNAVMSESMPVMPPAPVMGEADMAEADMAESSGMANRPFEPFDITTGGRRKTRRRRHSVQKSRKHRKQSHKKQRKSRRK